jgi:hypothetical protein
MIPCWRNQARDGLGYEADTEAFTREQSTLPPSPVGNRTEAGNLVVDSSRAESAAINNG